MHRVTNGVTGVMVVLAFAAGSVVFGQAQLRPGNYDVTDEVTIAGKMDKSTHSTCVEGAGLDNIHKYLLGQVEGNNCKVANKTTAGNRVTFDMTCPEEELRAAIDLTFAGDSWAGTIRMTTNDGMVIAVKTSARRTGVCR